jgi:hypothetical protein
LHRNSEQLAKDQAQAWDGVDDLFEDGPEIRADGKPPLHPALLPSAAETAAADVGLGAQKPTQAEALAAPRKRARSRAAKNRRPWSWAVAGFLVGIVFWHLIGFWHFVGDVVFPHLGEPRSAALLSGSGSGTADPAATAPAGALHNRAAKPRIDKAR